MYININSDYSGTGSRTRVGFLDEARGACILLMVAYHAAYDIIYLFGVNIPVFHSGLLYFAQPFVAGIFIFISGIACRFSRSNKKRGIITVSLGLVMSAVTLSVMPSQAIYFGILHLLGSGMLIFSLLNPLLDRLSPAFGALICTALFALTYSVSGGYLGIPGLPGLSLPASWSQMPWLLPLGLYRGGADYFPLLPWIFLVLAGAYLGVPFERREMPDFFYRTHSRALSATGRRTIYIYLLHQPVIYGVLYLIFR